MYSPAKGRDRLDSEGLECPPTRQPGIVGGGIGAFPGEVSVDLLETGHERLDLLHLLRGRPVDAAEEEKVLPEGGVGVEVHEELEPSTRGSKGFDAVSHCRHGGSPAGIQGRPLPVQVSAHGVYPIVAQSHPIRVHEGHQIEHGLAPELPGLRLIGQQPPQESFCHPRSAHFSGVLSPDGPHGSLH
jgi:hypothetical protein